MSCSPFASSPRVAFLAVATFLAACGASDGGGADVPSAFGSIDDREDRTAKAPLPSDPPRGAPPAPLPGVPGETSAPVVPLPYRGVNLAGAEFGTAIPGKESQDYEWPTPAEVDYFVSKGMNTFRIGFKWERMQPVANGELDATYVSRLDSIVAYATGKKANVILNPHNFARYYGQTVGSGAVPSSVFADFWRRLAERYKDNPRVIFNLVNEPHDLPTEQWVHAANAAIAAIRATGATNMVHVPGNGWTEAMNWAKTWYGTSNASALLEIVDPADNTVFEAHQYLDPMSGGKSDACVSATIGRERLAPFIAWLRANGKKGFLGEFAGGDNPTCNAAIADMMVAMMEASDVLVGWLWWAAGPAWREGYRFSIEPEDGRDKPQMALLSKFLFAP